MHTNNIRHIRNLLVVAMMTGAAPSAYADIITDWNATAGNIVIASKLPPGMPYRAMAAVQSAVYEAANAITKRYPSDRVKLDAASEASLEAAVAAANRSTLVKLAPGQQAAIDSAFQTTIPRPG